MAQYAATPVRVSIPFKAANDLGAYKIAVKDALTKLGCAACCSGHDIYFDTEKYFRMDRNFALSAFEGISLAPTLAQKPAHTVVMDAAIGDNIDDVFKTIDIIADLTGCAACCSGLDLYFNSRLDQIQLSTFRNGI